jgi:hypothetical protein
MRYSFVSLGVLATVAMTAAPLSEASAHDHFRGRGHGPGLILGLAGAIVGTAAVIATAPFRAVGAIVAPPPVYAAPPPAYYAPPQQAYYQAPPAYYAPPPPPVYYAQPQAYYVQPQGYYSR